MTLAQPKFDFTFTGALLSSGLKRITGNLEEEEGCKNAFMKNRGKKIKINSLKAGTHADPKACLSLSIP